MSVVGGFGPDPGTLAADMRRLDDSLASVDRRRAELLQRRNAEAADLIEQVVVPLYVVWSETNPPCPTCEGKGTWTRLRGTYPCPDCPESPGIQPFNKWVAGLANATALAHEALSARTICPYVVSSDEGTSYCSLGGTR